MAFFKSRKKMPKLYQAVATNNLAEVKLHLGKSSAKKDVHCRDEDEQTPLVVAIRNNNKDIADAFLNYYRSGKLDINSRDSRGYTPLHIAMSSDETIIMKLLNFPGVDVTVCNQDANTPLHYFCEKYKSPNCNEPFKKLVDLGADVNAVNGFGDTPLHKSVFNNKVRIMLVNLLLQAGAKVNQVNAEGNAPIHFAVYMNRDDLVSVLLRNGADIHLKGKEKKTPLELASKLKDKRVQKRLLRVEDLCTWLKTITDDIFDMYHKSFIAEEMWMDVVTDLDDDILKSIGVEKAMHRVRILKAAQEYRDRMAKIGKLSEQLGKKSREGGSQAIPSSASSSDLSEKNMAELKRNMSSADFDQWIVSQNDIEFTGTADGEELASGAFGTVYKGLFKGAEVAVKVLKPWEDKSQLDEFRKEFEICCALRDPNIVRFFGACLEPKLCMIMELCTRDTLVTVMQNPKFEIGWERFLRWCSQFARGMMALHNFDPQILHRDFKSLNILVTQKWDVKICDFGLSRFNTQQNQMGTLKEIRGTFTHCAPEVVPNPERPQDGVKPYTIKSDIFSMGIVMWEIARRIIDGVYSKPWYSEFEIPPNMEFMIILMAQKGQRPTIPVLEDGKSPKPGHAPPELVKLYQDAVQEDVEARPDCMGFLDSVLALMKDFENRKDWWNAFRLAKADPSAAKLDKT